MEHFWRDFLYGFRILFKKPGLTLLAIIALILSIGMTTSSFAVLNAILLKGLPFDEPERLYSILNTYPDMPEELMALPSGELNYIRAHQDVFESIAGYYAGTVNLSGDSTPTRYDGTFISPNFSEILRVEPVYGKLFTTVDGQAVPGEILISHRVWEERYRLSPQVTEKTVRVNGEARRIVGVLPKGFHFPASSDIWVPVNTSEVTMISGKEMNVVSVARLKRDTTPEAAQAQMDELTQQMQSARLKSPPESKITLQHFGTIRMDPSLGYIWTLVITAVSFVLLITCANVANLLIGRAATRGKEMAIRASLGATRRRIVLQLLTESFILSAIGGIGGLIYAAWVVDIGWELAEGTLPYWMNFELDWRVFLFVGVLMLFTALLSGVVPAWQASKTDLNEMLKDTNRTATSFRLGRFTRMLAVVQIAFSCALLFGAGITMRAAYTMSSIEPGFAADEIISMRMGLFEGDYPTAEKREAFYSELVERVQNIPGVESAAVTSWLAYTGNYQTTFFPTSETSPATGTEAHKAFFETISPEFFDTLDMQILQGRGILPEEDSATGEPVVLINRSLAEKHFGNENPIGRKIEVFLDHPMSPRNGARTVTIVGVVEDVRTSGFRKRAIDLSTIYVPHTQLPSSFMTLLAHVPGGDPTELVPVINKEILALDPHLPTYFVKTMQDYIDEQILPFRQLAETFVAVSFMALFLAAVGIYGMMAFSVNQRRHEIGIRMALGAKSSQILHMILRQGVLQLVAGIGIGLALAYAIGLILKRAIFESGTSDPRIYFGVLFILSLVAIWSCIIPARRATRLSPMDALRYE